MSKFFQWIWSKFEGFTNCVKREEFESLRGQVMMRTEFEARNSDLIERVESIATNQTNTIDSNTAMILSNINKLDQKVDRHQENTFQLIMSMKKG
jgi:hypothetical protein